MEKKSEHKSILIARKVLLAAALLCIFLLVYSPHLEHGFPFHIDEWWHLTNGMQLKQSPVKFFTSPFLNPAYVGFQSVIALFDVFVPIVLFYKFLPALNAVFISLVLFYFLSKKYNYWAGFFSIIFLASLRSNANILGLWFYVPVTGAIAFSCACLFFLEESLNKPKKLYYAIGAFLLAAFFHASSALVLSVVIALFYLFNYKHLKKTVLTYYKKIQEHRLYSLPFWLLLIAVLFFIRKLFPKGLRFGHFLWGPSVIQINYQPLIFYGAILSALALVGFYFALKEKKLLPFRIYMLLALFNLLIFPYTGFTIFSAYQRYMYHFMIAAVPLSAVGFFKIVSFVNMPIRKPRKSLDGWDILFNTVRIGLTALIFSITFISIFQGYYNTHPRAGLYTLIDEYDYDAMLFLRGHGSPSEAIIEHETQAEVIAPITQSTAISSISLKSTIGVLSYRMEQKEAIQKFFSGNCGHKKEVVYWPYLKNLEYVYSRSEINCDFIEEIYWNGEVYIYEIIREN